jgi:hypothetical protein
MSNGVVFEKNYVHTDRIGTNDGKHINFFLRDSENATVRYNIFDARGSDALAAGEFYDYKCDDTENHNIYNNVFIHDHKSKPGVLWACQQGTYFRNNIVVSSAEAHRFNFKPSTVIIDYNINYAPIEYKTLWADFTNGPHNIAGNPEFIATGAIPSPYFHLKTTSPAIDAGTPKTEAGSDYAGTRFPQGARVDIGAFEYVPKSQNLSEP